MTVSGPILVLDTATSRAVVALGDADGIVTAVTTWPAGQRHSEELVPRIEQLLAENALDLGDLGAIAVGTGPGAFTGLRVGLATAKTLAHQLGLPLVGVSSADALLGAEPGLLLLPAGSSDRIMVRRGEEAALLPGGREPAVRTGERLVAVDLRDRAPADSVALGERAQDELAANLLRLVAVRLAAGSIDDPGQLVPEYVTLPRGVAAVTGAIEWSRDHR